MIEEINGLIVKIGNFIQVLSPIQFFIAIVAILILVGGLFLLFAE